MYHAVIEGERPYTKWTHLPLSAFQRQIDYVRRCFHVLSLTDVLERLDAGRQLPDHAAVITFDDGYRNNYTTAYPVLREARLPATIFLTTGFLDSRVFNWPDRLFLAVRASTSSQLDLRDVGLGHFEFNTVARREQTRSELSALLKHLPADAKNDIMSVIETRLPADPDFLATYAPDFLPLSWDQAREMTESGTMEFGAHTVHHEILSQLPPARMREEIRASCDIVRRQLGLGQVPFAYPNGGRDDFNEATKEALREFGVTCGLSTIEGLNHPGGDKYEMKRILVGADMTQGRFMALTSGLVSDLKHWLGRN